MSRLAPFLACAAIVAAALMPRAAAAMEIQEVRAQALTAWLVEDTSPLVQLEFAWRHPPAPLPPCPPHADARADLD